MLIYIPLVLSELKYYCIHLKQNPKKTITSSLCFQLLPAFQQSRRKNEEEKNITNPIKSRVNGNFKTEVPSTKTSWYIPWKDWRKSIGEN